MQVDIETLSSNHRFIVLNASEKSKTIHRSSKPGLAFQGKVKRSNDENNHEKAD